tara:strand:+ start:93 stop:545 length:453 start_codon:yes stop_codon:yes gene_type:complete
MKKFLIIILSLIITSCGYQPIYVNNNLKNIEFYKISTQGENDINNLILNSLSLKENKTNSKLVELSLSSFYKIDEISKNSKGQTETYRSSILIDLKIISDEDVIKNKIFSDDFTYNKKDNKFELIEYQTNIKNQLVNGIIEDLILFLNVE